jgi:hypothetical protein
MSILERQSGHTLPIATSVCARSAKASMSAWHQSDSRPWCHRAHFAVINRRGGCVCIVVGWTHGTRRGCHSHSSFNSTLNSAVFHSFRTLGLTWAVLPMWPQRPFIQHRPRWVNSSFNSHFNSPQFQCTWTLLLMWAILSKLPRRSYWH